MRKTAMLLLFVLFLGAYPCASAGEGLEWPAFDELGMPFRPSNNYTAEQNSPDFSWQFISGATYNLIVCRDEALTDVAYKQDNIKTNFYNFPFTFEYGIYYWSVQYKTSVGLSKWQPARRFRVDIDAYECIIPEFEQLVKGISNVHPRILFTPENIEYYRKSYNEGLFPVLSSHVEFGNKYMTEEFPKEPPKGAGQSEILSASQKAYQMCWYLAAAYQVTKNVDYGKKAIEYLLELSTWDPNGTTSYSSHDQAHRGIAYGAAVAYDWVYNLFTEEEKKQVLSLITTRVDIMMRATNFAPQGIEKYPFDSHAWTASGYISLIAVALYNDTPKAAEWFRELFPVYLNIIPPWSNEDGGWSQGIGYYRWSDGFTNEVMMGLKSAGINIYDKKAWDQNNIYYMLYFMPYNALSLFGDEDNIAQSSTSLSSIMAEAITSPTPYSKWLRNSWAAAGITDRWYLLEDRIYDKSEIAAPISLPRGRYFKDIGWTASHTDLTDEERISLYFKSSQFGSYSHSHADQNSFVIDAYGKRLALDSGYYDSWGSNFDLGYSRQTYAHNSVTYGNGKGQGIMDITAKGEITNFITSPSFDLTGGDATESYKGNIDRFVRNIVYIRPDTFIVIDDLAAKDETTFELWLNAEDDIALYESQTGARITKDDVELDAKIQYPKEIKASYSNLFSGPDLNGLTPDFGYESKPVHKRVWFQTEEVKNTKMVTTIDVHKKKDGNQYVKSTEGIGYIKLEFENGTIAYVKTNNEDSIIADNIEFDGAAVIVKDDSLMLVDGTRLLRNSKLIFQSDHILSVSLDSEQLNFSAINEDANVRVYLPDLNKVERIFNDSKRDIKEGDGTSLANAGIYWERDEADSDYVSFSVYNGVYSLYLNDRELPGTIVDGGVRITMDNNDKQTVVELDTYIDYDGSLTTKGEMVIDPGFYQVEEISDNLKIRDVSKGDGKMLPGKLFVSVTDGKDAYFKLTGLSDYADVTQILDHESVKNSAAAWTEAEKYDELNGKATVYTTREFLSGGAGVMDFNTTGHSMVWNLEVPENGYYNLYIKYVASWDPSIPCVRVVKLGDLFKQLRLPPTDGYGSVPEQWRAAKLDESVYLEKGVHPLTIWAQEGLWNIDWIALEKGE